MYVEPTHGLHSQPGRPFHGPTADPCADFYQYSCGGWEKNNPIPPDQTSWSVYGKLYEDNLKYLRSILEQASTAQDRDAVTQKIGDYYAACMDETAIEKLGAKPIEPALAEIAGLKNVHDMAPLTRPPAHCRRDDAVRQRLAAGSRQLRRHDRRGVARTASDFPIATTTPRTTPSRRRSASATCSTCRRCLS